MEDYTDKLVKFECRGDELKIINDIKSYFNSDREDILSWLYYIEGEIKRQM